MMVLGPWWFCGVPIPCAFNDISPSCPSCPVLPVLPHPAHPIPSHPSILSHPIQSSPAHPAQAGQLVSSLSLSLSRVLGFWVLALARLVLSPSLPPSCLSCLLCDGGQGPGFPCLVLPILSLPKRAHVPGQNVTISNLGFLPTLARLPFSPFPLLLPLSTHHPSPPIYGLLNPFSSTTTRASPFASQHPHLHLAHSRQNSPLPSISSIDPRSGPCAGIGTCVRRLGRSAVGRVLRLFRPSTKAQGAKGPYPPNPCQPLTPTHTCTSLSLH